VPPGARCRWHLLSSIGRWVGWCVVHNCTWPLQNHASLRVVSMVDTFTTAGSGIACDEIGSKLGTLGCDPAMHDRYRSDFVRVLQQWCGCVTISPCFLHALLSSCITTAAIPHLSGGPTTPTPVACCRHPVPHHHPPSLCCHICCQVPAGLPLDGATPLATQPRQWWQLCGAAAALMVVAVVMLLLWVQSLPSWQLGVTGSIDCMVAWFSVTTLKPQLRFASYEGLEPFSTGTNPCCSDGLCNSHWQQAVRLDSTFIAEHFWVMLVQSHQSCVGS